LHLPETRVRLLRTERGVSGRKTLLNGLLSRPAHTWLLLALLHLLLRLLEQLIRLKLPGELTELLHQVLRNRLRLRPLLGHTRGLLRQRILPLIQHLLILLHQLVHYVPLLSLRRCLRRLLSSPAPEQVAESTAHKTGNSRNPRKRHVYHSLQD